ncbi:MAG TPA: LysE family translocator [Sediminibacterium sp.]|nr:LysE family translocator [Sediminibacterium sp.]
MSGIHHLETFLVTAILLQISPGNETIFILTRSIAFGKKAGLLSVSGIAAGYIIHTTLAAFGIIFILQQSASAFKIIQYTGAAYMLFLGWKMITAPALPATHQTESGKKLINPAFFRDGLITNLLNPPAALLFVAFLPQFIDTQSPHLISSVYILGVLFALIGFTWGSILTLFTSFIFSRLRNNGKIAGYINKICGIALMLIGIKIALASFE